MEVKVSKQTIVKSLKSTMSAMLWEQRGYSTTPSGQLERDGATTHEERTVCRKWLRS